MIIKNKFKHFAGLEITLPEVGKVKLDEHCMVEVPDDLGKKLVDSVEWSRVKGEDEEDDEEVAEKAPISTDLETLLAGVDQMSLVDLQELAAECKIKSWEKFKDKEAVLRSYLKNQLKKNG